jgi:hypothetical protein
MKYWEIFRSKTSGWRAQHSMDIRVLGVAIMNPKRTAEGTIINFNREAQVGAIQTVTPLRHKDLQPI